MPVRRKPARKARAHSKEVAGATGRTRADAPLSVVILAAGRGTRMQSDLPKVMQPLAGAPLLSYVLELASALEPASIHVVYGHGGERMREHFASAAVQWALQAEQLGTGHALLQAMPQIPADHRVLVLYGDVPLLRLESLRELVAVAGGRNLALLTARPADSSGYGRIVRDSRGALQRIVEERDATARERAIEEVNSGVLMGPAGPMHRWLRELKPRNAQREYYLTDVVVLALRAGSRVATVQVRDATEIHGINDRMQLAQAEAEYRRRRTEELLRAGVTLIDPLRVDIRGDVTVGRDVVLDVNVVLHGPIHLGDRVRVGPNCVLSDTTIGADTVLYPNCVAQSARIGSGCEIGPFARLRPQAQLADGVHIGNFVEIKNSHIGERSKVNHLSYVGDSDVGTRVNFGAGSITCNYDGVNKWRTRIGNGAFVGSGCMLVAPVTIGDGATIGAGSTITTEAPAGKLTLARTRQVTLENWQRPLKGAHKK